MFLKKSLFEKEQFDSIANVTCKSIFGGCGKAPCLEFMMGMGSWTVEKQKPIFFCGMYVCSCWESVRRGRSPYSCMSNTEIHLAWECFVQIELLIFFRPSDRYISTCYTASWLRIHEWFKVKNCISELDTLLAWTPDFLRFCWNCGLLGKSHHSEPL